MTAHEPPASSTAGSPIPTPVRVGAHRFVQQPTWERVPSLLVTLRDLDQPLGPAADSTVATPLVLMRLQHLPAGVPDQAPSLQSP